VKCDRPCARNLQSPHLPKLQVGAGGIGFWDLRHAGGLDEMQSVTANRPGDMVYMRVAGGSYIIACGPLCWSPARGADGWGQGDPRC